MTAGTTTAITAKQWTLLASLPLPVTHLFLCVATQLTPSDGSWGWFLLFLSDFPFSVLLLPLVNVAPPAIVFGLFGTLWWYSINRAGVAVVAAIRRRRARA